MYADTRFPLFTQPPCCGFRSDIPHLVSERGCAMTEDVSPPRNLGAEQGLLGAVLLDNGLLEHSGGLLPDHFFEPIHAELWRTISEIISGNGRADPVTLRSHVETWQNIGERTPSQYLGFLARVGCVPASFGAYAAEIRRMSLRRQIAVLAEGAAASALDVSTGDKFEADMRAVIANLEALLREGARSRELAFAQAFDEAMKQADAAYERQGGLAGLPTGLADLDRKMGGLQKSDLVVLAGRPAMGKEQAIDAPVLMRDGTWKKMGELRLGDELASVDWRSSRVAGIFPQGVKQLFTVTFSDGRTAEAGADHLWRVYCRHWERPRIMKTSDVAQKLNARRYQGRMWVDLVSGDFGAVAPAAVLDPYTLGTLIANGGLTTGVKFTTPYVEIVEEVGRSIAAHGASVRAAYKLTHQVLGVSGDNFVLKELRRLNLFGLKSTEKFIPPEYFTYDAPSRLRLLAGLIDGDGWVEKFGALRYATSSPRLAVDVARLVRSLGGIATTSIKHPKYQSHGEKCDGLPSYVINMTAPRLAHYLAVPEKKRRLSASRLTSNRRLTIKSVEPSRMIEAQCIRVTHPEALYVTNDYVVTHNTAMAANIAVTTARGAGHDPRTGESYRPRHVHFFSQEMSAVQLAMRVISELTEVPSDKLRRGEVTEGQITAIHRRREELSRIPMTIDETGGITLSALAQKARRIKRRYDTGLIIVDYLQLMSGGTGNQNRVQEITAITTGLKALAKELDVPIIALSQLSRRVEERSDKRPQLSDLRESGSIEQDADVVLFVYRDDYYLSREEPDDTDFEAHLKWEERIRNATGKAEVIIAKHRHAPTGLVELSFQAELTKFGNLAKGTQA